MKTNQKGFSVVELLIVIVVVGLLGTIGWLVYDRQNSKDTATQTKQTTPVSEKVSQFSATGFSLDTNKLPKGWTVDTNTADVLTVSSDVCFIEVIKENNATLTTLKKDEGVKELIAANDKVSSKGYVVTDKGASTLTITTDSGTEKVTSSELLWDMPDGGNPFRYSKAYSVQDGYYISLKRSCNTEAGFANTDAAISAIIFKQ